MTWKLALAALAALVATAAPAAAGPSHEAKAASVNFRMVEWDILPLTATKTEVHQGHLRRAERRQDDPRVRRAEDGEGGRAPGGCAARARPRRREPSAKSSEVKPGAVKRLTLNLTKGHYSLICNLPFHYGRGQFVDFYVR